MRIFVFAFCALLALAGAGTSRAEQIAKLVYRPDGSVQINGKPVQKHPGTDAIFLYYPRPSYPLSARASQQQGMGIYRMKINKMGTVEQVSVRKSSGWKDLDAAAVEVIRTWRAKPGIRREIDTEMRFVLP